MEVHAIREDAVAKKEKLNVVPNTLLEATSNLAENLAQSEPFLRFKEATRKLQDDKAATALLVEFTELQQKFRSNQHSYVISENDIKRLRELQDMIGTNDVIQEQGLAQETAIAFLREVNQEISNLLGVDFASLTRRSSGCC